jgi:Ca-activated chloride channel family protein
MNGTQKFQIARDAVTTLVNELPDNAEVALRAYGHRKNARQEGADEDTELLLPMRKLDRAALAAKLKALRARGKTPMAMSLREAAKDLSSYAGDKNNPVTLVLLTDGGEDTRPRQDPLGAADAVGKLAGVNFQLVGFDINRPDWAEQLQAMADRGNGQYLPASESATLLRELRSAVFRVPDTFTVADAKGRPVMKAAFGTTKSLREGKYSFLTEFGGKQYAQDFWINTEATTAIVFDASKIGVDKSGRAVAEAGRGANRRPAADDRADAEAGTDEPAPAPPTAGRTPPRNAPGANTTAAKKKFCTECGKPIGPGVKFCPNCGAKVAGG